MQRLVDRAIGSEYRAIRADIARAVSKVVGALALVVGLLCILLLRTGG